MIHFFCFFFTCRVNKLPPANRPNAPRSSCKLISFWRFSKADLTSEPRSDSQLNTWWIRIIRFKLLPFSPWGWKAHDMKSETSHSELRLYYPHRLNEVGEVCVWTKYSKLISKSAWLQPKPPPHTRFARFSHTLPRARVPANCKSSRAFYLVMAAICWSIFLPNSLEVEPKHGQTMGEVARLAWHRRLKLMKQNCFFSQNKLKSISIISIHS